MKNTTKTKHFFSDFRSAPKRLCYFAKEKMDFDDTELALDLPIQKTATELDLFDQGRQKKIDEIAANSGKTIDQVNTVLQTLINLA